MSEYVKHIQQKMREKGYSDEDQEKMYFRLLDKIQSAKREGDVKKVVSCCNMSLSCIPGFVASGKKYGTPFLVTKIPALELGYMYAIAMGAQGQMRNMEELVAAFPELKPWQEMFEQMKPLVEVAKLWKSDDEILPKELKKRFPDIPAKLLNGFLVCMDEVESL